jgi:hypothetical protein
LEYHGFLLPGRAGRFAAATANRPHRPIAQTRAVNRLETFEATHGRSRGGKSAAMVQLQGSA